MTTDEIDGGDAPQRGKFLANEKPGLFAVFEDKEGKEKVAPVVGYFEDAPGRLSVAIVTSNGVVTRVSDIKTLTFKRVQWETSTVSAQDGSKTSHSVQGAFDQAFAAMDRAFASFDKVFGSIRKP